ncbi:MAG TPA: hypothetical protein VK639_20985, partial [Terriglobales bacterium]|nr:hypothetical protein [Terriglobales bacterium]
ANSSVFFDPPVSTVAMKNTRVPSESRTDLQWHELEQDAIEVELLEQELGPRIRKTSKRTVLNLQFWTKFLRSN